MTNHFNEMISRIVNESIEKKLQVEAPEEWEALIQDIRNNFSAHYPESMDVEDVAEAVISHFDENVAPLLHEEIRAAIFECYTSNVARELIDVSAKKAADQMRRELELPIRREVERNHDEIAQRIRQEMVDSIRAELKKELEPSVRRELRLEILTQLKLDDI